MSRMSDLWIEIEYRLEHNHKCEHIAKELKIPIEWVNNVADSMIREYTPIHEVDFEE